jgi:hypothetical protein
MSFCFLPTRISHDQETLNIADKIAKDNDATLVWVGRGGIPGNDLTGWFASVNLGSPFDDNRCKAVADQLLKSGINWR